MEFLEFLRRHFAEKRVVASQNVGCFSFRLRVALRNSFTTTNNRIVVDYTYFIIGYDNICLCCFVISQNNVDEMLNTSKTYQNHQWPNLFHFLITNILTTGC